jgi:hypothetical protein
MGPISCPERSERNYHNTPRNKAEKRSGPVRVLSLIPFTLEFVIADANLSFKADITADNHSVLS